MSDRHRRGGVEWRENWRGIGGGGWRGGAGRHAGPARKHGDGAARAYQARSNGRRARALQAERTTLRRGGPHLPGRARLMIKAVKGMRDILPPSSAVWNQVEAAAREV